MVVSSICMIFIRIFISPEIDPEDQYVANTPPADNPRRSTFSRAFEFRKTA